MHLFDRLLCLGLVVMSGAAVAATSPQGYLQIEPSSTYPMPSQLVLSAQGTGDFIITNTSGSARSFDVINLPKGVERVAATGTANDCGIGDQTVSVPAGGTCTMRLGFTPTTLGTNSFSTPTICADKNVSYTCASIPKTTVIAAVAPSNQTTLQVTSGNGLFSPGEVTAWKIQNGGYTANNISLHFPRSFQSYIDTGSVTRCSSTLPNQTCNLHVIMKKNTPLHGLNAGLTIQAGNSQPIYQAMRMTPSLLTVSPAVFVKPGVAGVYLDNKGSVKVTGLSIEDIANVSTIHGITPSTKTCGSSLDIGAECEYLYSVSASAYGQGAAKLTFIPGEQSQKSVYTHFLVAKASVVINPNSQDQPQIITINKQSGSGSFLVKNISSFTWLAPKMTNHSGIITLQTDQAGGCSVTGSPNGVPAGGTCTVEYTVTPAIKDANDSNTGTIDASGSNASTSSAGTTVTGDFTLNVDTAEEHLSDVPLILTNSTGSDITISSITATNSSTSTASDISWCGDSSSDCKSTYTQTGTCSSYIGKTLATGASCLMWFEGNQGAALSASTTVTENLNVKASDSSGNNFNIATSLDFSYQNLLFAGGDFSNPGSTAIAGMTDTDGTTWFNATYSSPLTTGGTVNALLYWNGDIYAGGQFSVAASGKTANNIARWNGSAWNILTSASSPVGEVFALASYDNKLVLGGDSNSRVETWDQTSGYATLGDGITTSDSNTSVQAIAVDATPSANLVIGGNFQKISGKCTESFPLYYFSVWDTSNNCWTDHTNANTSSNSWQDVNNAIYAFKNVFGSLYAGGAFTQVMEIGPTGITASPINAGYLTSYGSSSTNPAWTYSDNSSFTSIPTMAAAGGDVYALTGIAYYASGQLQQDLVVGGNFTSMTSQGGTSQSGFGYAGLVQVNFNNDVIPLGILNGTVRAVTVLSSNVYAGGDFDTPFRVVQNNLGSQNTWLPIGGTGPTNASVLALATAAKIRVTSSS